MSIDAEKMYPLPVKFELIRRAVDYFMQHASEEDKGIVGQIWSFVTFEDHYWIYGGDLQVEEKGLTIGGY